MGEAGSGRKRGKLCKTPDYFAIVKGLIKGWEAEMLGTGGGWFGPP